jgi:hypothetical protein
MKKKGQNNHKTEHNQQNGNCKSFSVDNYFIFVFWWYWGLNSGIGAC